MCSVNIGHRQAVIAGLAVCDVLWVKVPAPLKLLNRCILQ